jgi:hypothetical protein
MELKLIGELLTELINRSDRVSLPGIGSFVCEEVPAMISAYGTQISPPGIRLLFKTSEIWNDELLEKSYAESEGISQTLAKVEIAEQMKKIKSVLAGGTNVSIPGLGDLSAASDGSISFTKDEGAVLWRETSGLEPLNIKPLLSKGEIENISARGNYYEEAKGIKKADVSVKPKPAVHREPARIAVQQQTSGRMPRGVRTSLTIFLILFIIAVLLVLIYIFRDDLRPVLEYVLYNSEERELLQYIK